MYGYYFILLEPILHQTQAMTIMLHEHDAGIAILTPGTAGLSGFRAVAHPDRQGFSVQSVLQRLTASALLTENKE